MGREFIDTFEKWADDYDRSVAGGLPEYREVFKDYDVILSEAASHARGNVLEFGVGTGNLTRKLLGRGLSVYGVEPSEKMRQKALEKLPNLKLSDGDFLDFIPPDVPIDTIASSFAFHHLTNDEKMAALKIYDGLLAKHGRIVFADTLFDNETEKRRIEDHAKEHRLFHLLKDLQTEYYSLRGELYQMFRRNHFVPYFRQMNQFVWLIIADKKN